MAKKKEKVEEENIHKIESLKEVIALHAARANCAGQGCSKCPMQCDKDGVRWKGGCDGTKKAMAEFLEELMGIENTKVLRGELRDDGVDNPAVVAYETVMALDVPELDLPDKKPEQKEEPEKEGRCFTCLMSQMHTSGILWCKSFGNFVHEDGFCYRYKSDKIETEEPVDN